MIESYIIWGNECNKGRMQFANDVKDIAYLVKNKWKKTEKKKKIKTILTVLGIIVFATLLFIIGIAMVRVLEELIPFVIRGLKEWYGGLGKGIQNIIGQIFFTIVFGGMMIYEIINIPSFYKTKANWGEKIKCILGVVIFEVVLGCMILAIWIVN